MTKELQDAANYFAHNNFDMHETNSYQELKRGFIEGAEMEQERICDDEIINLIRYSLSNAEARRIIKGIQI
jgi:hypothetical protein